MLKPSEEKSGLRTIYFLVVLPMNALIARMNRGEAPHDPTTKKCPQCLSEIPIAATRCAFCTVALEGPDTTPAVDTGRSATALATKTA